MIAMGTLWACGLGVLAIFQPLMDEVTVRP